MVLPEASPVSTPPDWDGLVRSALDDALAAALPPALDETLPQALEVTVGPQLAAAVRPLLEAILTASLTPTLTATIRPILNETMAPFISTFHSASQLGCLPPDMEVAVAATLRPALETAVERAARAALRAAIHAAVGPAFGAKLIVSIAAGLAVRSKGMQRVSIRIQWSQTPLKVGLESAAYRSPSNQVSTDTDEFMKWGAVGNARAERNAAVDRLLAFHGIMDPLTGILFPSASELAEGAPGDAELGRKLGILQTFLRG